MRNVSRESAVGCERSQVALLRFAERPRALQRTAAQRDEGNLAGSHCQSKRFGGYVALEKTDLSSQPVAAPKVAASLPANSQVVVASRRCVALLPATLGELSR